jgi:hypothetical protein
MKNKSSNFDQKILEQQIPISIPHSPEENKYLIGELSNVQIPNPLGLNIARPIGIVNYLFLIINFYYFSYQKKKKLFFQIILM